MRVIALVWLAACGSVESVTPDGAMADGAAGDAAVAVIDGPMLADALGPDAFTPTGPPVVDGQAADLVVGQASFTDELLGLGAGDLNTPVGLASDGTAFWIGDGENDRVVQWNARPIVDGALANLALGQTGVATHDPAGPTQTLMGRAGMSNMSWLFHDGTHLIATDAVNHRVLIWNSLPAASGEAAALVLGQTGFTTFASGNAAAQLEQPRGVWSDGTRLVVADGLNHRVLVWTSFPTTNGEAADIVLGQPAFGVDAASSPPTASSLNLPTGVFFDGARLYVSDTGNHRVLIWDGFPTMNGEPADVVVGQGGFATGLTNAGGTISAVGLYGPQGLTVAFGSLFVADTQNHRVLVYTPAPTTSGAAASAVLGKPDFTTAGTVDASVTTLGRPRGLLVVDEQLWVTQSDFHRATRFGLSP